MGRNAPAFWVLTEYSASCGSVHCGGAASNWRCKLVGAFSGPCDLVWKHGSGVFERPYCSMMFQWGPAVGRGKLACVDTNLETAPLVQYCLRSYGLVSIPIRSYDRMQPRPSVHPGMGAAGFNPHPVV